MSQLSYTNLIDGTIPTASDFNSRFLALVNLINNGIESDNIADSAVTTAKIANSAVTTAKINTGAVTGAKIAMGSDAQGDTLYYNGSSYARLAAGTSGYLLSTQGAGANPQWVANTGGTLVYTQTGSPSAVSSFTISSLVAGARYKLIFSGKQNTADGNLTLTINGDTGANYKWGSDYGASVGQSYAGSTGGTSASLSLSLNIVANDYFGFTLNFFPLVADTTKTFFSSFGFVDSSSKEISMAGKYAGAAVMSSVTFTTSGGTITGSWFLYRLN